MSEDRWTPDEQLVAAVLAGSCTRRMSTLSDADRSWVVAGLGAAGKTAEEIAARLGCSLRLVRTIRALPMTRVCLYALTETNAFDGELRLRDSALASLRHQLGEAVTEAAVLRTQRDNLIAAWSDRDRDEHGHARLCGVCGEPMAGYNLYRHPATGKRYCRACGRRRAAATRARRAAARAQAVSNEAVQAVANEAVANEAVQAVPEHSTLSQATLSQPRQVCELVTARL